MTDWQRPGGDVEIAEPEEPSGTAAQVGERSGSSEELLEDGSGLEAADEDEVVRVTSRARPTNAVLLLVAILVVVVAQAVISWLALDVSKQARDQSAIANGLQHCLIQAQLNANSTTDPSGTVYKAAVQSCLNK